MNRNNKSFYMYFVIIMGLLLFTVWIGTIRIQDSSYTKGEFVSQMENNEVAIVKICPNKNTAAGSLEVTLKSGEERLLNVTDISEAEALVRSYNLDPVVESVPEESWFLNSVFPILIVVVVCVFFFVMMNAQNSAGGGGNGKMMNFGRSRARLTLGGENKIKLDGVAGLKEEKEELQEIVEFLREPGKFTKVGARIPKGVLLEGAPGTGKTLLAKAIAGEANVPFFSISGSDFVEMFVGVGASRVRDMFAEAKRHAPCIIFIDEIDAIGKSRDNRYGGQTARHRYGRRPRRARADAESAACGDGWFRRQRGHYRDGSHQPCGYIRPGDLKTGPFRS